MHRVYLLASSYHIISPGRHLRRASSDSTPRGEDKRAGASRVRIGRVQADRRRRTMARGPLISGFVTLGLGEVLLLLLQGSLHGTPTVARRRLLERPGLGRRASGQPPARRAAPGSSFRVSTEMTFRQSALGVCPLEGLLGDIQNLRQRIIRGPRRGGWPQGQTPTGGGRPCRIPNLGRDVAVRFRRSSASSRRHSRRNKMSRGHDEPIPQMFLS